MAKVLYERTTASNSFLVSQYLLSVLDKAGIRYHLLVSVDFLRSTAPNKQFLAPVSRRNRLDSSGNATVLMQILIGFEGFQAFSVLLSSTETFATFLSVLPPKQNLE